MSGAGTASLRAPAVTFKNTTDIESTLNPASATTGLGTLQVQGDFIDLVGAQVLQGIGQATFKSSGDLRLDAALYQAATGSPFVGSLTVGGNLELDAARIYPSTATTYSLTSTSPTGQIVFGQTSASPGQPLSAGGSLSITANTIVNAGSLYAPFGQLSLTAADALTLAPGSVTSVSGSDLIALFGNVQNAVQWVYDLTGVVQSAGGGAAVNEQIITGLPARQVSLNAPSLTIRGATTDQKGAIVDLTGGGELVAYGFVPGTGGTQDALSNANSVPSGLYAVLPQLAGQYAPYDPEEFAGSPLTAGDSVYLSGVPGLPAGMYPLLPARYALLPGAFLVQEVNGSAGKIAPGISASLQNGAPEVAGYLTFGNTGLGDPLYSGFAVYPGSYAQQLATYQISTATDFFSQAALSAGLPPPMLPADAGKLVVTLTPSDQSQLTLLGSVLSQPAKGGIGADIEIGASNIEIVTDGTAAPPTGTAQLLASVLQGWDAGRILIGGERDPKDDSAINVFADNVTVGKGVSLSASEIMLVAGTNIEVQSGATLASTSGVNPAAAPKPAPAVNSITLNGPAGPGAALLAVSDLELPTSVPTGTGNAGTGTVNLESGASLVSAGAIAVEGPGAVTLAGSLSTRGATVSLASSDIRFGSSNATDGLTIDAPLLATLQQSQALRLTAANSIQILSDTSLGVSGANATPSLSALTLIANSIQTSNPGTVATFGADVLTLAGSAGAAPTPPTGGTGQLTLVANTFDVGPGTLGISGFGTTTARVSGALEGKGTGSLAFGGDATITAGVITAETGAQLTLSAPNGTLNLLASGADVGSLPLALGATINATGNLVNDQASIVAASGSINTSARRAHCRSGPEP